MSVLWETATIVKNGVTYWLKDAKARELIAECYSPSNPPPTPSGNTWYATCSTDAGVGSKTAVSATGDFSLVTGSMVRVLFSKANIASNPTLSVDGSTAKNIRPVSNASGMDYMWKAGEVVDLVYDGSNFVMTKGGKADTSFYGITKLSNSTDSSATDVAATSKAVKDVKDAIPAASSATPQDLGTAAPGSSSDFSRADHVHNKSTYTASDVGLGNVDNVQQYSASNPPPYPVTSVFGRTGNVLLLASDLVDLVYPVGSIYLSVSSTSPATLFGGTWERIEDRFLLAAGTAYAAGSTGGEAAHTLTKDELPNEKLDIQISNNWLGYKNTTAGAGSGIAGLGYKDGTALKTSSMGSGSAHNNMPPYLVVYMWERTA